MECATTRGAEVATSSVVQSSASRSAPERPAEACVLVVEDDAPLRRLVTVTLQREGLAVTAVADGAQAIERLEAGGCHVVLLDLMMPRVNGWQVMEWLKEHPAGRPRTLVVVTAFDQKVF